MSSPFFRLYPPSARRPQLSTLALTGCIGLGCLVMMIRPLPASAQPASLAGPQHATPRTTGTPTPASPTAIRTASNAPAPAGAVQAGAAQTRARPAGTATGTMMAASTTTASPAGSERASGQPTSRNASASGGPDERDVAQIAATCANCHGPDENHPAEGIPLLFHQPEDHLKKSLMGFKYRPSPHATVMPRLMKGIDDAEIAALARWFAAGGKPNMQSDEPEGKQQGRQP